MVEITKIKKRKLTNLFTVILDTPNSNFRSILMRFNFITICNCFSKLSFKYGVLLLAIIGQKLNSENSLRLQYLLLLCRDLFYDENQKIESFKIKISKYKLLRESFNNQLY
ncbi:unnamed protein product [Paramecium octaurelia]|uniref:Uncharacterized protein n=1 Tax=Paramecium octaurelia TaxID=43137 RepID=A0A8S1V8Y4_PAROT|nr:unnamed protein product [Paramecium octaurelia]